MESELTASNLKEILTEKITEGLCEQIISFYDEIGLDNHDIMMKMPILMIDDHALELVLAHTEPYDEDL